MKTRKKLKLLLMVLICIIVILIGFVGIYTKQFNRYANKLPDFKLSTDLTGTTVLELVPDDSTVTKYYDKEGKEVDSTEVTEETKKNYTSKEEKVNDEEVLIEKNYQSVLRIFKDRLKFLDTNQYSLDLDKKTGKILLTFEDDYPEDVKSILPMQGKLEIIDTNTKDVLLSNTQIQNAEASYANDENGNYVVYLNLKLTKQGLETINHIEGYKTSTDDNGEVTTNKFTVEFDGDQLEEVSYDDIVMTGKTLRITIASGLTSTSSINSKMNTATVVSKLTNIGETPIVYEVSAEEYVGATENINTFHILMGICAGILVIVMLTMIINYKTNGLVAVLGIMTNVALLSIIIRLTNVALSTNTIAAVVALIILNGWLVINLLKAIKENNEAEFKEYMIEACNRSMDVIMITLLLFAVFAFAKMQVISAMGLFLFWGWFAVLFGSLVFTCPLLAIKHSK